MCTSDSLSDHELSHDQPLAVSSTQDSSGDADISDSSAEDFLASESLTDENFVEKTDELGRVSKEGKSHIAMHACQV